MSTNINKKINHMFLLMGYLAKGEELYVQNEVLLDELEVNERTLRRYLEDIHTLYTDILVTEKKSKAFADRKVTVYRIVDTQKDVSKVLRFFLENDNELTWVIQLLQEQNPTLLDDYSEESREALESAMKKEEDIFLFNSRPFELMDTPLQKKIFSHLKRAVKNHEYCNIEYRYKEDEAHKDIKCLKLIFTQNNWYLTGETAEGKFRWFRISFIKNISYSRKSNFQKSAVQKYADFFERFESAMSLPDAEPQRAILLASADISLYFEEHMKPFFKSQEFIRRHDDGSIEFSVDYTQPLEILPFIKQWSPGMKILEPLSLREQYIEELQRAIVMNNESGE